MTTGNSWLSERKYLLSPARTMLAALVLFAIVCLTARADVQEPKNLMANPGMEEVISNGFAVGWGGGEFGKLGSNVILDSKLAHSGKNSIRVGTNPGSFVTCKAKTIAVKPNTTYYVTWWCRTDGMKQARAYLWLLTNKAQRVVPDANQFITQEWTQHFTQYTTTADETSLGPVLTTHRISGPECYAWFDDVGVYEGGFPSEIALLYKAVLRNRQGISETALVLSKSAALTVWTDNLAAKIYREDGVPDYAKPAKEVILSGARGEQDYAQVAVLPAADLAGVELAVADLKGPGTIPAARVEWWPVGYCSITKVKNQQTRKGFTPDPLLRTGPVEAKAGQNTPFLISVSIPREAKAGTYKGSVTIKAGGKPIATVPLAVQVYNFDLPQDPAFRTVLCYTANLFKRWDQRPLEDIEKDIIRVLYAHGTRGKGTFSEVPAKIVEGKVVCDFTAFDQQIQWSIDNLHLNVFFLGPQFGGGTSEGWEKHSKWLGMEPLSNDFNRLFPEYLRQVGQHLRQKGWLDMAYLYLWDEPEPSYFDKVVALQKLALQADPGFKIWETTSPNNEAFWGVVKAWAVPFGRPYFTEESVDKRRAAGDEIWVYNIPASLEGPTQIHRLWFWQAAKYGAVGALLWSTTYYHKIDPWEDITPEPYVIGHHQESLYVYEAGQAIMIYPDKQGGPPLPTLRLKLLQKGIDDFGYLTILQQRLMAQAQAQKMADPQGYARAEMRKMAGGLVKDINSYVTDTSVLASTRAAVARRIEELELPAAKARSYWWCWW